MHKKTRKPPYHKIVLRLPDLDQAKSAVLNSLSSPCSRRNYKFAMEQFITWYCSEPRLTLNRAVVLRFRLHLESLGLAAASLRGVIGADGARILGSHCGLARPGLCSLMAIQRLAYTCRTSPSRATISYSTGLTKNPRNSREMSPATITMANGF